MVLHLRKTCPDVRPHLLLPCERVDQTAGWRERDVQLYDYLVRYADEVIVLGEYHHGCMMARNQALVDAASFCLCWYDRTRLRSGTGQTVRMAERAGLRVWNLFVG